MAQFLPMQGMAQHPAGQQFDRVMPNPIPVGAPNTQFPIQTALPPIPAPGQMPMTPNPRLGVANAIANQFGGAGNPGAFQSAMGDWRNQLQDWRAARPDYMQGMDRDAYRTAIGDWRQQRPDHPDFRSFWSQPSG